ncbi:hypothetical protein EBB79_21685 (plasmid) [Parasedimentitalea marina]|uniref:Uncharacterized protein n=1 Tax=Parasedimentitalea marina TaxID=2483033 RepID=A0A3T0N9B4_9RHOB|nr:hypothetical protein EBB79_21685 [Parasedimentitalea marina]
MHHMLMIRPLGEGLLLQVPKFLRRGGLLILGRLKRRTQIFGLFLSLCLLAAQECGELRQLLISRLQLSQQSGLFCLPLYKFFSI